MRTLFADAGYWIALLHPRDALHAAAQSMTPIVAASRIVTSEAVLVELLDAFAAPPQSARRPRTRRGAPSYRRAARDLVGNVMRDAHVTVVTSSSALFHEAVSLYGERLDQTWGMTDCMSFTIMRARGITEALAHDEHFVQAGFRALLREKS